MYFVFIFKECNKENLAFEVFHESLFAYESFCAYRNNVSIFFPDKTKFVSSANMTGLKYEEAFNKSFI